ncbi:ZDHHC [Mytilus coruscus]|uniref:ZDHHC n=1 Tax=Mytilus coruscus TaxID=42192 RepID=A0A6J7ZZK7_MYTCO|nr:ZDHHC [Mytilus coruscus]
MSSQEIAEKDVTWVDSRPIKDHLCVWIDCCIGSHKHSSFIMAMALFLFCGFYGFHLTITTVCTPEIYFDCFLFPSDCRFLVYRFSVSITFRIKIVVICNRKCELKLIRRYEQQTLNQDIQDEGTPVKQQCVPHECPPSKKKALYYLAKNNLCNTDEKFITTSVEIGPFETCFHERSTTKLKRGNVEDRLQLLKVCLKEELQHEIPDEDGKPIVCLSCYKAFNKYTKSDDQEKSRAKTDMYLTDCLSSIEIMECNISNIDTYCYQNILKYVVSSFLSYKPLLLSKVYNVYASEVDKAVKDFNLMMTV